MKQEKNYQEEYVFLSGIRHYLLHYPAKPEDPALLFKSPIMGTKDLLPLVTGMIVNMQVMKELMAFDLRTQGLCCQMPVDYVLGELDQQTPIEIGVQYFNEIEAPDKKLYLISNAGHLTMIDNAADYRKAIVKIADKNREEHV